MKKIISQKKKEILDLLSHPKFNMAGLIEELKQIATTADRERLTPLVDHLEEHYPDIYKQIIILAYVEPETALTELIKKWPWLAVVKFWTTAPMPPEKFIALIQEEIRARRAPVVKGMLTSGKKGAKNHDHKGR